MKKTKLLNSLLAIISCSVVMLAVFSAPIFKEPKQANVKLSGVNGGIKKISHKLNTATNHKNISSSSDNDILDDVYLGGFPIGLKLYADGVVIVGTEPIDTINGNINTADKAGLKIGDVIKKINGEKVLGNKSVSDIIEKSNGENIHFEVLRDGKAFNVNFKSEFSESEKKYKAGLWIRDSSAGIGTVTFCTDKGYFASLGHAVCDIDTKKTLPVSEGDSTTVNITGYKKGSSGTTGEICGFLESRNTGKVYYNGNIGVYGQFNSLPNRTKLPIAKKEEILLGEAKIYTTLENDIIEEYTIEVESIDFNSKENKNMVIRIVDKNLLEKTGGIIQGMSGSPIVQNGKIIGAVTHVFLNDPTGGFGIFAETMLKNTEFIAEITDE